MEENLPREKKFPTSLLVVILSFVLGAAVGAAGFYFYSQKFLIPKYREEMMSDLLEGDSSDWDNLFQKMGSEYRNPFDSEESELSEESEESEEYVNPFEELE